MSDSTVFLKRTEVVGRTPTTSDLAPGQVGVNIADKKIFARHDDPMGSVVQIAASPNEVIVKNSSDASPVHAIRCLTQGEYDALGTYDPNTLYFIK